MSSFAVMGQGQENESGARMSGSVWRDSITGATLNMFVGKGLVLTAATAAGISVLLATNGARNRNAAHREACRRYSRGESHPPQNMLSARVLLGSLVGGAMTMGAGATIGNELVHRYMSHLPLSTVRWGRVACIRDDGVGGHRRVARS